MAALPVKLPQPIPVVNRNLKPRLNRSVGEIDANPIARKEHTLTKPVFQPSQDGTYEDHLRALLEHNDEMRAWIEGQLCEFEGTGQILENIRELIETHEAEDDELSSGTPVEDYFEEFEDWTQHATAFCVPDGAKAYIADAEKAWDGSGELAGQYAEVEIHFEFADGRQTSRVVTFLEREGEWIRGLDDVMGYLSSFVSEGSDWFDLRTPVSELGVEFFKEFKGDDGRDLVISRNKDVLAKEHFFEAAAYARLWFMFHEGAGLKFQPPFHDETLTFTEFAAAMFALGRLSGRGEFESRHKPAIEGYQKSLNDWISGAQIANRKKAQRARQNRHEAVSLARALLEQGVKSRRKKLSVSQLAEEVFCGWVEEDQPALQTIRKYLSDAVASGALDLDEARATAPARVAAGE